MPKWWPVAATESVEGGTGRGTVIIGAVGGEGGLSPMHFHITFLAPTLPFTAPYLSRHLLVVTSICISLTIHYQDKTVLSVPVNARILNIDF